MAVIGTPITTPPATGSYIDQSDIKNVFGEDNIVKWSNLDNDGSTADTNRIQKGIDWAETYTENRFRNGRYAVPFSSAPEQLQDIMAKLAGIWLYESRGLTDENTEGNKLADMRVKVDDEISLILNGARKLSIAHARSDMPDTPQIV